MDLHRLLVHPESLEDVAGPAGLAPEDPREVGRRDHAPHVLPGEPRARPLLERLVRIDGRVADVPNKCPKSEPSIKRIPPIERRI